MGALSQVQEHGGREKNEPSALTDRTLLLIVAAVTLPVLWMGYGTDIDVANVLEATETIRSGDYQPSRTPGAPVFEAIVALLDLLGGHLLVNLATAGAAAALVIGIARLVRAWGHGNADLVALAFLASPVTIIAATSLADFVWALTFFVWGALAHLSARDRPRWILAAGALFALATGARLSTAFVAAAFLVADGWDRGNRERCLRTALVALPLGVALYVPSWLAYDRTFGFLETADGYRGLLSNAGLFLVKNYTVAGPTLAVVVALALPALWRSLARWGQDPMVRFSVLALVATEGLFFQLPWKLAHLLPSLLALILWIAASERGRQRRFMWVLVAAVAINGLVTFRPLAPDEPGEATTGTWNPAISLGLLANDIDCRWEHMQRPPSQPNVERAWSCTLKPLRGPADVD